MEYLLLFSLIMLSYIAGIYWGHQGLRNAIDRPLLYSNELALFTLTILFSWVPIFIALYLALRDMGLVFVLILVAVRFIVLPTLFNNFIQDFMNKKGI